MTRPLLAILAVVFAACSKPAAQQQQDAASAGGAGGGAAQWAVVVLYHHPKDTAAFEKYYAQTHLPLLMANQSDIGFTHAVAVKFVRNLDGSAPAIYRKAEVWFASEEALKKGIATPGFKKVGDDFKNFVTGGLTALVSVESPK